MQRYRTATITIHFLLYLGQDQQAFGILVVSSASGARQEAEEFMGSKEGASIVWIHRINIICNYI